MARWEDYRYLVVDRDGRSHDCCAPMLNREDAEADARFHDREHPHRAPHTVRDTKAS